MTRRRRIVMTAASMAAASKLQRTGFVPRPEMELYQAARLFDGSVGALILISSVLFCGCRLFE